MNTIKRDFCDLYLNFLFKVGRDLLSPLYFKQWEKYIQSKKKKMSARGI